VTGEAYPEAFEAMISRGRFLFFWLWRWGLCFFMGMQPGCLVRCVVVGGSGGGFLFYFLSFAMGWMDGWIDAGFWLLGLVFGLLLGISCGLGWVSI
jgi:hypothetical protein